MKKIAIVAIMAIAAVCFTACGNKKSSSDKLKNGIDSLSYALGKQDAERSNPAMILQQMELDSALAKEVLKGFEDGLNGDDDKELAYNIGVAMGVNSRMMITKQINPQLFSGDSTQTLSIKNYLLGFKNAAKNKPALVNLDQQQFMNLVERIQNEAAEKIYGDNKKKGQAFIAKVSKDKDVKKLNFTDDNKKTYTIYYKVIKQGTGDVPTAQQTVKMEYEGKTVDGKVFDASAQHGGVQTVPAGAFVPGFTAALTHMPVGSTWEVYIPYEAAYGTQERGEDIKPFSTLIFKITLHGIETAQQGPAQMQMPPVQ